jgi:hypothetical protein
LGLEVLGNSLRSLFPKEEVPPESLPPCEVLEPNVLNRNYYHPDSELELDTTNTVTTTATESFAAGTIASVTSAIVDALYPSPAPSVADPVDLESDAHTVVANTHHSMLEDHNFSEDLSLRGSEYSMSSVINDDDEEAVDQTIHHSHTGADTTTTAAAETVAASSNTVEGQSGWADVICEEDCVVFSWNFRDLYELGTNNLNKPFNATIYSLSLFSA